MVDPTTANILLSVPTRGSDPGTWDTPVNSNTSVLDGYLGGVQNITVSNVPIPLTAPAGVVTAGGGPTQAQNAVLNFTGTLTANVQVTLPLPGYYIIRHGATGNFVLSFRALGVGNVIGMPPGQTQHIFNDGTNVFFANLGNIGELEVWTGLTSMPSWVGACTIPPYLLADGSTFLIATYPILAARYSTTFGGNGTTTSATPDVRGRVPLIYDGTGTRITTGGCGINGQVLGASADSQSVTLTANQIPNINSSGVNNISVLANRSDVAVGNTSSSTGGGSFGFTTVTGQVQLVSTGLNTVTVASTNTGGALHTNVQPSLVTGIAVVRAA